MSIENKLTYLDGTKEAIKQAIIGKGVSVTEADTFRSYATKIGEIQGGSGGDVTKQYVDEQLALKADKTEIVDMLTKTEASTTYKTIASEWFGTQSEYDLITEKDPNVTYFITEG